MNTVFANEVKQSSGPKVTGLLRHFAPRKDDLSTGFTQTKRLFIVFLLGFSSGLPFALLGGTLQAWYADVGMSVKLTGALSLLGLPYLFKMFLAPFLDKYPLSHLGRRKSWMLLTQGLLLIGFNALAWFSPTTASTTMLLIAFALTCCSALQDVVVDAQRIEYLPLEDHGLGAALAMCGYRLALLLGGGLALVLAHYHGWVFTYRVVGLGMGFGLFATLWSKEPVCVEKAWVSWVSPFQELIARPKIGSLLLFILLYKAGEAFTTSSSGIIIPFLRQGLDFSLETIGYVNQFMGLGALITGGLAAGIMLRYYSLFNSLLCFGLFQACANLLFVALALVGKQFILLAVAVFMDNLAAGMGSTALVALLMRVVNRQFTATQFALLAAVSLLPRTFSGLFAPWVQGLLGWSGLYVTAFVLSLCFLPYLFQVRHYCLPRVEKG